MSSNMILVVMFGSLTLFMLSGLPIAFVLGGLYAVALLVARRARRGTGIPFGPWMLAGALMGVAAGPWLWTAYLGAFQ